jgi:hypothetical protein
LTLWTWVPVRARTAFLVRRRDAEDVRPLRPRVVGGADGRRLREQLELVDRLRALAVGGAEAVGAGVAAADDHDVLVLGRDELALLDGVTFAALVLQRQVVHREVDALELAARDRQVAADRHAAGEHDGVERPGQLLGVGRHADVGAGLEDDPFPLHQAQAAIQDRLLHLELGDAVAHQPADAVGALEHRDAVAGLVQLIGCGEARRTGADHRDRLARPRRRRRRLDPAFFPGALDDRPLDRLDRHRVGVDAEHARPFARRRAQPARELGEVVGRKQPHHRRLPAIAVDEVVPVRDQVAERAALVAERDPAVHAARTLIGEHRRCVQLVDLAPVLEALRDRPDRLLAALQLDEPCRLPHQPCAPTSSANPTSRPSARAAASAASTRL